MPVVRGARRGQGAQHPQCSPAIAPRQKCKIMPPAAFPLTRNLEAMTREVFDLVIIGGGITGSCIARDAALRGLSVALVEKRDFSHATSSATSKLVHGGLRYLKNLEFGLIRESLRERRIWERIAPHLVYPLPFIVPLTRGNNATKALGMGLTLYDLLSYDRRWLDDEDQRLPRHRRLSREEAAAAEPVLAHDALEGGQLYYDCQMYAPERLGLACLFDAARAGALLANHAEVENFLREGAAITGVRVKDRINGTSHDIRGTLTINAAGPWADLVMGAAEGGKASHSLIRSKGIHVITRKLVSTHALALVAPKSHLFVLPWRGCNIIGTTDTVFTGPPDQVRPTEADIAGLIATTNSLLPNAKLTRADVRAAYAGLRPLVDDGSKDSYGASRKSEVFDHEAEEGLKGLISAVGGKWTTSRSLAEKALAVAARRLGRTLPRTQTAQLPLQGESTGNFKKFAADAAQRHPALAADTINVLARNHGAQMDAVVSAGGADGARRLSNELPDITAQIHFAATHEMAMTLEDALFRRTGIATLGHPGHSVIEAAASIMARHHGWTAEKTRAEIAAVEARLHIEDEAVAAQAAAS